MGARFDEGSSTSGGRPPERHLASRARGAWAESLTARWYERQGFVVADRNWRCPIGEIDLVAVRGRLVVCCEVKARATDAFGSPALAVGPAKQRRLRRLAAAWLATHPGLVVEVRFDVACVVGVRLDVIEGAF